MDLRTEAQDFADELQELLRQTITERVKLKVLVDYSVPEAFIGYGLTAQQYTRPDGIPVRLQARKAPRGYLGVYFNVRPDHESRFLLVQSSVLAYGPDPDLKTPLMHYDYEREKDQYPAAHLQVDAESDAWDRVRPPGSEKRPFGRLHFPVGGRRFRPSVEELIEFLITEVKVDARPGWDAVLADGRRRFEERQLRAAVRRNPQWAFDALVSAEYLVQTEPDVYRVRPSEN